MKTVRLITCDDSFQARLIVGALEMKALQLYYIMKIRLTF